LWQWAGNSLSEGEEQILANLARKLASKQVDNLTELITETEYSALQNRVDDLMATKTFPLPSEDWPAIPWPAF
jgi:hypothetical protein